MYRRGRMQKTFALEQIRGIELKEMCARRSCTTEQRLADEDRLTSEVDRFFDSDTYDDIVIRVSVVEFLGTQFSGKYSV